MFLGVCIVLSLFAVQLLRLQALDASAMAKQALGSRLTTVTVDATRGQIVDRDGVVLATSLERYNVTVDQTTVTGYFRYEKDPVTGAKHKVVLGLDGAARDLAPLLRMDVAAVRAKLDGHRRFAYVAKGVTPEVWRKVDALQIPGIYPETTSQRAYPADGVGASVVGFMSKDGKPLGGLELKLNRELTGQDGSVTYERDPGGRHIPTGDVEQQGRGARRDRGAHHRPRPAVEGRAAAAGQGRRERGAVGHGRGDDARRPDPRARQRADVRPQRAQQGQAGQPVEPRAVRGLRAGLDEQADDRGGGAGGGRGDARPRRSRCPATSSAPARRSTTPTTTRPSA